MSFAFFEDREQKADLMVQAAIGYAHGFFGTGTHDSEERVRQFYRAFGPFLKPYRWQIAGAYVARSSDCLYDTVASLVLRNSCWTRHCSESGA